MTTVYVPVKRQQAERTPTADAKPRAQPRDRSANEETEHLAEPSLDVEDLRAGVALFASVGELVEHDDDAEAVLEHLKQTLEGDEAQAQFKARLQEVYATLERTLSRIEIVEVETVGKVDHPRAQRALRPFRHAARAVAGTARRLVGSARGAVRARREPSRDQ
jgi:hypothetical protein